MIFILTLWANIWFCWSESIMASNSSSVTSCLTSIRYISKDTHHCLLFFLPILICLSTRCRYFWLKFASTSRYLWIQLRNSFLTRETYNHSWYFVSTLNNNNNLCSSNVQIRVLWVGWITSFQSFYSILDTGIHCRSFINKLW